MTISEKINQYKKFVIRYGVLIAIFLIFHRFFEDLVDSTFIIDIFLYPSSSGINDSIFFIAVLVFFISTIKKKYRAFKYSNDYLIIITLITALYAIYRFPIVYKNLFSIEFDYEFEFLSLESFPQIKYLDIIPIYTLIIFVLLLIPIRNRSKTQESRQGYLFDEPLSEGKPDLLDRENIAEEIALKISNTKSQESSFALGINGEWGSGKTSFIYLIEKHIPKENKIIIKFNPWLSHDVQNIAISFFRTLSKELKPFHSDVSGDIIKYAKLLVESSNSNYSPIVKTTIEYLSPNSTLQSEFEKINQIFKKLEKQIIIIIDDVDRLDHQEINELLKLIRNSANFANVVFIVAYDRNYLIDAISKLNSYSPFNYLEKIFQYEFILPKIDPYRIPELLKELIIKKLNNTHKELFVEKIDAGESVMGNPIVFRNYITTIRDVIRFTNSFLFVYNRLRLDVSFTDLFNLEVLKFKYPSVFRKIFKNRDKYLSTEYIGTNQKTYTLRYTHHSENNEGRVYHTKSDLEIELEREYKHNRIELNQIKDIISIINNIFPVKDDFTEFEYLTIADPESFDRYSIYGLLKTEIPQEDFNNTINSDYNNHIKKIDLWIKNNKSYQALSKYEQIESFNSINQFENTIKAIFYYNRKINGTESYSIKFKNEKIYNLIEIGKPMYPNNNINSFVLDLLKNASTPFLQEISFINYILMFDYIPYFKSKEEAERIQIDYFKTYLDSIEELDSNFWDMLYGIDGLETNKNSIQINSKVKSIFIKYLKEKFLINFLNNCIKPDRWEKNKFTFSGVITNIFGTQNKFFEFLQIHQNKENNQFINEIFEFKEKLSQVNGNYTEFDFEFLSPKIEN